MEVQLTPDQKAFARRAVESGRFQSEAEAALARGEGRVITQESMRELAAEVRERGRARLIAELTQ